MVIIITIVIALDLNMTYIEEVTGVNFMKLREYFLCTMHFKN